MTSKRLNKSMAVKSSGGAFSACFPSAGKGATKTANGKSVDKPRTWSRWFSQVASRSARFAGHPAAFLTAVSLVIVWALTGPLFDYSDTWQLVINTSTTIVTFLMVFLLQHSQNRDTLALQVKLSELIVAVQEAENRMATVEDLSEEELERLHEEYRRRAEQTFDRLSKRRRQLERAN